MLDLDEMIAADMAEMHIDVTADARLAWLTEATDGLGPAMLFDAARDGRIPSGIEVIGRPGERLRDLMLGDYIVTRVFGEGPIGSLRVVDMDNPSEVWPGERLPADTAVLRLAD